MDGGVSSLLHAANELLSEMGVGLDPATIEQVKASAARLAELEQVKQKVGWEPGADAIAINISFTATISPASLSDPWLVRKIRYGVCNQAGVVFDKQIERLQQMKQKYDNNSSKKGKRRK